MVRRRLRALALLVALLGAVVAGCGGDDEGGGDTPPDGGGTDPAALLTASADAMRRVTTTAFDLTVEGDAPALPVSAVDGTLTRDGDAQGTAVTRQLGVTLELRYVLVADELYLEGPTGGFQRLGTGVLPYDPSLILDGDRGLPALLEAGRDAALEGTEDVDGVATQRVRATFPVALLTALVPGTTADTEGRVWIAAEGDRTVRVRFPVTGGTVTIDLSDFDAPVDITAPV